METVAGQKWHYVYYSYEEGGRGYIGKRSSSVPPDQDPYLGSFTDKTFKPTKKVVIALFDSAEDAIRSEIALHRLFRVDKSEHFANKVIQPSPEFVNKPGIFRHRKRTLEEMQRDSEELRKNAEQLRKLEESYDEHELEQWRELFRILKSQRGKYFSEEVEDLYMTTYPLRSPLGTVFPATDLEQFCFRFGLDFTEITRLLMGEIESHKGWTRGTYYIH